MSLKTSSIAIVACLCLISYMNHFKYYISIMNLHILDQVGLKCNALCTKEVHIPAKQVKAKSGAHDLGFSPQSITLASMI